MKYKYIKKTTKNQNEGNIISLSPLTSNSFLPHLFVSIAIVNVNLESIYIESPHVLRNF